VTGECVTFSKQAVRPDFISLAEKKVTRCPPEYSAIIPLRLLSLKKTRPELWQRVDLLMDHVGEMSEDERNMWKSIAKVLDQENVDEFVRLVGIFLTNGVNQGNASARSHGVYPTFSFISHECVANSRFQVIKFAA